MLRMHPNLADWRTGWAVALVIAAALYTPLLCLINTRVWGITNTYVALADGAITAGALLGAAMARPKFFWVALALIAANFLLLAIAAPDFDPKAIRDIIAPGVFLILGAFYGGISAARTAFIIVGALVVAFGLWEYCATDSYTAFFDVLGYYIARGVVDPQAAQYIDNSLFVSGVRGAGRSLAPMLGPHRVSSIFLEPVSMGNFGAIAAAIALALGRAHWRTALFAGTVALFAIVMADARFAVLAVCFFIPAIFAAPARWANIAILVMPIVVLTGLIAFGAFSGYGVGDDLPTRLAQSGRAIAALSFADWMGFGSRQMGTLDSGYYYALKSFGLPFCIVTWWAFARVPAPDAITQRLKMMLAVYICALLCISNASLFALKTCALLFFVMGCMMRQANFALATAPLRVRAHGEGQRFAPA